MSANLVALCGFIYLYVAIEQALRAQWWVACMYFGYAFANVGAYMIAKKGIAA
jgi:hypothetical protein